MPLTPPFLGRFANFTPSESHRHHHPSPKLLRSLQSAHEPEVPHLQEQDDAPLIFAYEFRQDTTTSHQAASKVTSTSLKSLQYQLATRKLNGSTPLMGMGCPTASSVGFAAMHKQLACPEHLQHLDAGICWVARVEEIKLAALKHPELQERAIIIVEQDMLWLRSPHQMFSRWRRDCDVILTLHSEQYASNNGPGSLNTGIMLLRANNATRTLWEDVIGETRVLTHGPRCQGGRNQMATLAVVLGRSGKATPAAPRYLIGNPNGVVTKHGARVCFDRYEDLVLEMQGTSSMPDLNVLSNDCEQLRELLATKFAGNSSSDAATVLHFKSIARDEGKMHSPSRKAFFALDACIRQAKLDVLAESFNAVRQKVTALDVGDDIEALLSRAIDTATEGVQLSKNLLQAELRTELEHAG